MTGVPMVEAPDGPVAGLLLLVDGPTQVTILGSGVAPGSRRWPVRWIDTVDGHPVAWCGERRNTGELPPNTAALVLAARLGCPDLTDRIGLNARPAAGRDRP